MEGHNLLISTINLEDQKTVTMELIEKNGVVTQKVLRYDDFLSIVIDKEIFTERIYIPKLPEPTVSIRWDDEATYEAVIFVPGGKRYANFLDQDLKICYPNILFRATVLQSRMTGSAIFAVKEDFETISEKTEVFNYPYGNVAAGSGSICWGNTALPDILTPCDLNKVLWMFFSAKTNNHLWHQGENAMIESIDELYLRMTKAETFVESLLVPAGSFDELLG